MLKGEPSALLPEITIAAVRLLQEFPRSSFDILFCGGFWDGPLSGMMRLNDEFYWFNVIKPQHDEDNANPDGDDWGDPRVLAIFRLSAEQLREEEQWHKLFQLHVRPKPGHMFPKDEWKAFYDPASKRTPLDLRNNEIIGWWQL